MRDVRKKDDADSWKAACRLARKYGYDKLMRRLGKARLMGLELIATEANSQIIAEA